MGGATSEEAFEWRRQSRGSGFWWGTTLGLPDITVLAKPARLSTLFETLGEPGSPGEAGRSR
jgi:hypothetical protein